MMQVVAHIPPACTRQTTSILSSIDFDKDARLFATAGVSKRRTIYDCPPGSRAAEHDKALAMAA